MAKWAVLHCWRIRSQQHVDQVNHNADVPALYNSGSQKIIIFIMFNLSMIFLISISNVWTKKCPKKNFWCPFYFLVLFNRHTETFRYLVYSLHGPRLTADINIWEASTTDNLLQQLIYFLVIEWIINRPSNREDNNLDNSYSWCAVWFDPVWYLCFLQYILFIICYSFLYLIFCVAWSFQENNTQNYLFNNLYIKKNSSIRVL